MSQHIKKAFFRHVAQTSDAPLAFSPVRAEGIYLYDETGRDYIDLISGISVSYMGHGNPDVQSAIRQQSESYLHTMVYGEHIQSPQVHYAERLIEHFPKGLEQVYWVNSGSEAIEGALKLAKRYTKRQKFVALRNAYHGSTHGALSLMDNQYFNEAFRPLMPGIVFMEAGATDFKDVLSQDVAGFVFEPVQGEAGAKPLDKEWIQSVLAHCKQTGIVTIADEIQTGFGRTGSLWSCNDYEIEPDILCLAKALGGGMPLGAFAASKEIMSSLMSNPVLGHITTFGGHPVCCAAGLAAFNALLSQNLVEQVAEKGTLFKQLLKTHKKVKSVSGKGLLLAFELDSFEAVNKLMLQGIKEGFLLDWFLHNDHHFRIAPPLTITTEEIKLACDRLVRALDRLG